MSTKTLLSEDLWRELSVRSANHRSIRAAIAYVTARHLDFHRGDLLVCDASDPAISGGPTSASVLRSFANQGATVYSYAGLHSKVAVIGDEALIGSANLSERAGVDTCEASLLTDDPRIVGLVQGFIEEVKSRSEPVTEGFLLRIEALPVIRSGGMPRRSREEIIIGPSRVWLVATRPLSDRIAEAEEALEEAGRREAQERLQSESGEIASIRFSGKSRFRSEARSGHLVIEMLTESRGNKEHVRVYPLAPILYRQDDARWTRFYLSPRRTAALWLERLQGGPHGPWDSRRHLTFGT